MKLLTPEEVCESLQIGLSKLRRLVRSGAIAVIETAAGSGSSTGPKGWRFEPAELERFVQSRRTYYDPETSETRTGATPAARPAAAPPAEVDPLLGDWRKRPRRSRPARAGGSAP